MFLDAYADCLAETDAKLICCLGMAPDGKTIAVMDFDNNVGDVLTTIKQYIETLDKMKQGP